MLPEPPGGGKPEAENLILLFFVVFIPGGRWILFKSRLRVWCCKIAWLCTFLISEARVLAEEAVRRKGG
jgi:hypothetical protein